MRGDQAVRADAVDRDRVVAPVGDVQVVAVPAHTEMGGVTVAGETGRERGYALDLG